MGITSVVIIAVLFAVIITAVIFIVKNIASPSKLDSVPKLIKDGKLQQAQKTTKAIITKDPRNYLAHYYLGKAYLADKKYELAYMEYKTVNMNALFNGEINEIEFRKDMAALYARFNQDDSALKEYLLLTRLEPNNSDNNLKAAEIYEKQGNAKLAMGFYQKTIMSDKKNPKPYTAAGRLLLRAKNYKQAKQALETSVKLNPENHENYYLLGKLCKETKDLSTAVKLLEKSERDPQLKMKALIEKGTCLMMADQNDRAIDAFQRVITNSKDLKSQDVLYARYFLGNCYEKARKIDKAIEQWETIFKVNAKFKDVATKLDQYKELETNDGIKEYLTSNNQGFMELCKKVAMVAFNLQCQKIEPTQYGCQMLATEEKKENWMNIKQQIFLCQFYRSTDVIEEGTVRKLVDTVKQRGYVKGIMFASSEFSHGAVAFTENRPIILVSKTQLEEHFKKISF